MFAAALAIRGCDEITNGTLRQIASRLTKHTSQFNQ
jgi:hypothetical protein